MDRISQEVTPLGTIDYTYDNVGRRKTMTVLGQTVVNYCRREGHFPYTYYTGAEITLTTGDNLKSITDRKGQVTTFKRRKGVRSLILLFYFRYA